MKVAASNVALTAAHSSVQRHSVSESLEVWRGPRPGTPQQPPKAYAPRIPEPPACEEETPLACEADARVTMLKLIMEAAFGVSIRFLSAGDWKAPSGERPEGEPAAPVEGAAAGGGERGWGLAWDYRESWHEAESTSFEAEGTVQTADGRSIAFSLSLSMERSYTREVSASLRLGDAVQQQDPLVINFDGSAAELTDTRIDFDLEGDGELESMPTLRRGSGFLVFDRDEDGVVDDGTELFGPQTGSGFRELKALDDDDNGWIDEGDAAYAKLRVWQGGDAPDRLATLAELGVGALCTSSAATPFALKDAENEQQGEIARSGVWLAEEGSVGTIQELELVFGDPVALGEALAAAS